MFPIVSAKQITDTIIITASIKVFSFGSIILIKKKVQHYVMITRRADYDA